MDAIRKILVPVDFGGLSEPTLEKAIAFAQALGASVTILHVYEYSLWGIDGGPESASDSARRIRARAEKELDRLLSKYRSHGVEVVGLIREGIPWSETLSYAREKAMDLIVMGTHGRRGLPRALLGSVAEKIVRFATVPVLTIRGLAESAEPDEGVMKGGLTKAEMSSIHGHGLHGEDVLAVSGAIAGATTGALAGPPGVVAGAVIGAAFGMAAGKTLENEEGRKNAREEQLDREIGVSEGDLGAAPPNQPAARFGAYSASSTGAGTSATTPSEGPMQTLDEDD